jgi:spermidine synthase
MKSKVPPRSSISGGRDFGAALFLFGSGVVALIYQILWIKQLSLVVGVDVYAISTAVSAFFAGLALGSALASRWIEHLEHPFLFYGVLEGGIALLGIGSTVALARTAPLFAKLDQQFGVLAWLVPFLLVGMPATLMGATLPVIVRAEAPRKGEVASTGGRLYAFNTAGAIVGALATPFFLIPQSGVLGTAFFAAALGVSLMLAAFVRNRTVSLPVRDAMPSEKSGGDRIWRALIVYAIAGAIALGYEVVWSQLIVQFMSTRAFAFSIVLATYLAGLALGSALYARSAGRLRDAWGIFGVLITAAGLIAVLEIAAIGNWFMSSQSDLEDLLRAATGNELAAMCGRFLIAALGIVFVPAVCLGAAFPAAVRLISAKRQPAKDVGLMLAVNTTGGIAGTFLTGFALIPSLGLVRTLGLLAVAAAAVGLFAASTTKEKTRYWIVAMGAVAIAVSALTPRDKLVSLLSRTRSGGQVVFYEESAGGTVAVVEQHLGLRSSRRLYIQGVSNSGDPMPSLRYMRLQALLPILIHRGDPRSALVIGLGTGITAGALLSYPDLTKRVCAELLPAVVHAAPMFKGNFGAPADPRIDLRMRDGRRELMQNAEQYDLITLEPPPPSAAGVVNLYSRDFYELAKTRLRTDGIFAQWWPLAAQNDEDSQALVRSFLDAFPYATLWTTELHEMLLVGSLQPIELNIPRITARFSQPATRAALQEVGIASPASLMATWVTGREGLEAYAENVSPVTDDRPKIEYATWVQRGEFLRVLPRVLGFRTDPLVLGADKAFDDEVARENKSLLDFYRSGVFAYRGDHERWQQSIDTVMAESPENPYYLSFMPLKR